MSSEDNFFMARTRDISSGGLFIETQVNLAVGTAVGVTLRLQSRPFKVVTEVAWILEEKGSIVGIGLRFTKLSKQATAAIEDFLGARAPMAFDMLDDLEEIEESPPKPRRGPPPLPRPNPFKSPSQVPRPR